MENTPEPVQPKVEPSKAGASPTRIVLLVAAGAVLALGVYMWPHFHAKQQQDKGPAYERLKTGGTSVVFAIVDNMWRDAYRKKKGIEVQYESIGSTKGVKRLIEGDYPIAFTHAPISAEQQEKARSQGGEVVHVPVLLCGVAAVYNIKESKGKAPLNFSGEVLANIFLGKIDTWNDPALKALNPGVQLPSEKITVVHREDSSGTTLIFTDYLQKASAAWRQQVGAGNTVKWPVGVGAPRNLGVAIKVQQTDYSISYVDRLFTNFAGIVVQPGAIQNRDKSAFVRAENNTITAAVASGLADIPADLTLDAANKPGKDSYPISGVIYAICYQTMPAATQKKVVEFLNWATHDGQKFVDEMGYTPLPPRLVERVEERLKSVKSAS